MTETPYLYSIRGTKEFQKLIKLEAVKHDVTIEEYLKMAVQSFKSKTPA